MPVLVKIILVLSIIQLTLSQSDDKHFVATDEWQEIREGQKVPAGLHYRMNLETGKKEAKILVEDNNQSESSGAIITDPNADPIEKMSQERTEEVQALLEKMKGNKDIENIKHLMLNYHNATSESKLVILEDLDYYMHQIDNARDFVSIGGLIKVVMPALRSLDENPDLETKSSLDSEKLVAKGAILLGSAAQSNVQVQNAVFNTDIPKILLEVMIKENLPSETLRRLVFALSALTRGNSESMEKLHVLGTFKILFRITQNNLNDFDLTLKSLTFISDMVANEEKMVLDPEWCHLLTSEVLYQEKVDLDHIDRLVKSLDTLLPVCSEKGVKMRVERTVQKWLTYARYKVWKADESDDSVDFSSTIKSINRLVTTLKDEL